MAITLSNYYDQYSEGNNTGLYSQPGGPTIPNPNDPNNNSSDKYGGVTWGGFNGTNPSPLITFPVTKGAPGSSGQGLLSSLAGGGLSSIPGVGGLGSGLLNIVDGATGGIVEELAAGALDAARITKFFATPQGIAFNLKQTWLQRMNTKVPHGPGPNNNSRVYNLGFNILAQVPLEAIDIHINRHGLVPGFRQYPNQKGVYSQYFRDHETKFDSSLRNLYENKLTPGTTTLTSGFNFLGNGSDLYSYGGGPKSKFGLGKTIHRRWTDTTEENKHSVEIGNRNEYPSSSLYKIKNDEEKFGSNAIKHNPTPSSSSYGYGLDGVNTNKGYYSIVNNGFIPSPLIKWVAFSNKSQKPTSSSIQPIVSKENSSTTTYLTHTQPITNLPGSYGIEGIDDNGYTTIKNKGVDPDIPLATHAESSSYFTQPTSSSIQSIVVKEKKLGTSISSLPGSYGIGGLNNDGYNIIKNKGVDPDIPLATHAESSSYFTKPSTTYVKNIIDNESSTPTIDINPIGGRIYRDYGLTGIDNSTGYPVSKNPEFELTSTGSNVNQLSDEPTPTPKDNLIITRPPNYTAKQAEDFILKLRNSRFSRHYDGQMKNIDTDPDPLVIGKGAGDAIDDIPLFYGVSLKDRNFKNSTGKYNTITENPQDISPLLKDNRDMIDFRFEAIDNDIPGNSIFMVFRSYLSSIQDSYSPTWNSHKYLGRGEKVHTYSGFDRSFNFSFKMAAVSRASVEPLIEKLNFLASNTAPDYNTAGRMRGPFMKITIGDYVVALPGFINSLTYSIDDNAPWDVALWDEAGLGLDERQLPHSIDVSVNYTPIHDFLPRKSVNDSPFILKKGDPWYSNKEPKKPVETVASMPITITDPPSTATDTTPLTADKELDLTLAGSGGSLGDDGGDDYGGYGSATAQAEATKNWYAGRNQAGIINAVADDYEQTQSPTDQAILPGQSIPLAEF